MSKCENCLSKNVCRWYENGTGKNLCCADDFPCPEQKDKDHFIKVPCKVGDKVYVITDCSHIMMYHDNDYLTGTGAIECPFEDVCNFTDCNDDNTQVLETYVNYMGIEDGSEWYFRCEHINRANDFNEIGKTVFLTKEEAEEKLKELKESECTNNR